MPDKLSRRDAAHSVCLTFAYLVIFSEMLFLSVIGLYQFSNSEASEINLSSLILMIAVSSFSTLMIFGGYNYVASLEFRNLLDIALKQNTCPKCGNKLNKHICSNEPECGNTLYCGKCQELYP